MNRSYQLYLQDILRAAQLIREFVEGFDVDLFFRDSKTSSAVIRQFEIIGEAAKNIPDSIRERHAHISWKEMAGMRDRLIHGYFGIDYQLVWDSAQKDVPKLLRDLPEIIEREGLDP